MSNLANVLSGNVILAIASVLDLLLTAYMWIIIAAAVISWVNPDPYNPIVRFLYGATEPVLRPIRKRMPRGMGIDFSPMIVVAVIIFIQIVVVKTLKETAFGLH